MQERKSKSENEREGITKGVDNTFKKKKETKERSTGGIITPKRVTTINKIRKMKPITTL